MTTFITPDADGTIGAQQLHTIIFSEVVTGLTRSDFSDSSGVTVNVFVANIEPRGSEYAVLITPTAATFTLTLAADSVMDSAGNSGPATDVSVDGTAAPLDTIPPTVNWGSIRPV